MSVIVDIDHETGDLTQYTATVTDSGDLSVAAGAALAGTGYGLSCLIDDTTAIYGQNDLAFPYSITGRMRARFYIDPNSLAMANGDNFVISDFSSSAGPVARIVFRYTTVGGYNLRLTIYNDSGSGTTVDYATITDAPHYVEIDLIRATTNVSADGSLQTWIDGASQGTIGSVDNYDRFVNYRLINFGPSLGLDAGTSGTFYLDELVINDDGGAIGPVVSGNPWYAYAMQ